MCLKMGHPRIHTHSCPLYDIRAIVTSIWLPPKTNQLDSVNNIFGVPIIVPLIGIKYCRYAFTGCMGRGRSELMAWPRGLAEINQTKKTMKMMRMMRLMMIVASANGRGSWYDRLSCILNSKREVGGGESFYRVYTARHVLKSFT